MGLSTRCMKLFYNSDIAFAKLLYLASVEEQATVGTLFPQTSRDQVTTPKD